jgi:hypothetical protein
MFGKFLRGGKILPWTCGDHVDNDYSLPQFVIVIFFARTTQTADGVGECIIIKADFIIVNNKT